MSGTPDATVFLIDSEFMYAINCVFEALRPQYNFYRKPAQQRMLQPMIEYLRSKKSLGPGECAEFAYLFAGEYGRPKSGRPSTRHQEQSRRNSVIKQVLALEDSYRTDGRRNGKGFPFRLNSTREIADRVSKKASSRSERVTAEEIQNWMKNLTKDERKALQTENS